LSIESARLGYNQQKPHDFLNPAAFWWGTSR
jgi:hypothetical protein